MSLRLSSPVRLVRPCGRGLATRTLRDDGGAFVETDTLAHLLTQIPRVTSIRGCVDALIWAI